MLGRGTTDERYTPWGTARDTSQQAAVPYRYTEQREEAALGLYDYGARWYDPSIGRFIQADTIVPEPGNPQSLNRYSYALNNPMKYTDPTGHTVKYEDDYMPTTGMQNYRRAWDFYEGRLPSKEEWIRDTIYMLSVPPDPDTPTPRQEQWQAYLKMRDIVGANLIQQVGSQEKLGIDYITQPIIQSIEQLSGQSLVTPLGDGFGLVATSLPIVRGIALGHIAFMDPSGDNGLGGKAEEFLHHLQQHADSLLFFKYLAQGLGKWPTRFPFTDSRTSDGQPANTYEIQGGLVKDVANLCTFSSYLWYFRP
jgi:RHS repeat-associated protein